jgi:DNA-binding response OmpR family regulator
VLDLTLRREGWDIQCTGDGVEACELATADPPDMVLLDVAMPGMDGLEVCRRLRANTATARVAIVMITAGRPGDLETLSQEAGADAFVRKPFSPTELIGLVHGLLAEGGRNGHGTDSGAGHRVS